MNKVKLIWLTLTQLPGNLFKAVKQGRNRLPGPTVLEAERLDRIRNPSKYRGR